MRKSILINAIGINEKLLKNVGLTPSKNGLPAVYDPTLCGVRFDGEKVTYGKPVGKSLREFVNRYNGMAFEVSFQARFDELGFTFDLAKNKIYKRETIEDTLLLLSVLGYTKAYFSIEDAVVLDDEPYYGYLRYRYTGEEIEKIDAFARSVGVELIPQIPCLTGFLSAICNSKNQNFRELFLDKSCLIC
jgi:hypothetical protein